MKRAKLTAARLKRGWSQEALAEQVSVTRNTVSAWERGMIDPYPVHVHSLCKVFAMSMEELDLESQNKEIASNSMQDIMERTLQDSLSELDKLDIILSRRQALQSILSTACTVLTLSPYLPLPSERQARLEKALKNPSRVDREVLGDLSEITGRYWRLCANVSASLLSGISGHFSTIMELLKWSHPTPIYQQLCLLASENAQILGKTLYDIREYQLAWSYYSFSIKAAETARNGDLRAVGLGRVALLLIYCDRSSDALPFIQDALQTDIQNARNRAWLTSIEAEIQASLMNYTACKQALDATNDITHAAVLKADTYATGFNRSRQLGYEGACYVRLRQPELALPILQNALNAIGSISLRRSATLYADMGYAYAQLGEVKHACSFAEQALDITAEIQSISTLQRLQAIKVELEPWNNKAEVKNLQMQFTHTVTAFANIREPV